MNIANTKPSLKIVPDNPEQNEICDCGASINNFRSELEKAKQAIDETVKKLEEMTEILNESFAVSAANATMMSTMNMFKTGFGNDSMSSLSSQIIKMQLQQGFQDSITPTYYGKKYNLSLIPSESSENERKLIKID